MSTEGKDEAGGLDPGDDEALWSLLGRQTPPAQASPYFSRRILREVALTGEGDRGMWSRIRRFWTLTPRYTAAWSGACAVGVLCLSLVWTLPASRPPLAHPAATFTGEISTPVNAPLAAQGVAAVSAEEAAPGQDEELIADLDDLLSREESRLWTEDDSARF